MPEERRTNRRIVLAARPQGLPKPSDFRLEEAPAPEPVEGPILLRTLYLSLDPYMRGRMSDRPSCTQPMAVGDVMVGGTVCRVEASRHPGFSEGELVAAYTGWQDYALSDGAGLQKLDPSLSRPSYALGVLGMPGFTGYMGLTDIGAPQPGETVVVSAATGAVGSVVGQVAKILGSRAVGIAGGPEKCRYAVEELGLDACVDRRAPDFPDRLKEACPSGIDVYFENAGGPVFQAVLPLLNAKARVPVCGLIAQYNTESLPEGPDRTPLLMGAVLARRLTIQGFIIFQDYADRFDEFLRVMRPWVEQGRVKYREDVVEGLEHAPEAFVGLLEGRNFGKLVVHVAD